MRAGIFYPIGTKVRLASGGPDMLVVETIEEDSRAVCAWDGGEATFLTVCLDLVRTFHIIDDGGWS